MEATLERHLRPNRPGAKLTERELGVLRGIADGKPNAEIGRDLFVSEDTIKTHARRIYAKLGARDRAHAVRLGFDAGLLAGTPTAAHREAQTSQLGRVHEALHQARETRRKAPDQSLYAQLYDAVEAALSAQTPTT